MVPVILMSYAGIEAVYEQHWQPAVAAAARDEGLPPATLEDVRQLLSYQGDRQDQVRLALLIRPVT